MDKQLESDDIFARPSLNDPLRRSLFSLVSGSAMPMGRDDAAEALGLPRGAVAHYLDRFARCGLLDTEYERRTGRTGSGATPNPSVRST